MTTPPEAFERAADYIEEHGWTRGTLTDEQGRVCAEEALEQTCNSWYDTYEAICVFCEGLGAHSVHQWNDEPHRTQKQVVKELRACAQRLRGEK